MDLQAISAALTSLKAAGDLAKAASDVKGAVDIQAKVFELQRVILAAQQDTFTAQQTQSTLLDDKRNLEKRVRELEAWGREKERYQLAEVGSGTFAFALKPDADGAEPPHLACANCFQHGRRSILQANGDVHDDGQRRYRCLACSAEILVQEAAERSASARARSLSIRRGGPGSWMG